MDNQLEVKRQNCDKISKILNPDKAGEVSIALDRIMHTVVSASKAA